MFEQLISQVGEFLAREKRPTFTVEAGRGQTYASGEPTLYGHGEYERGSVLAGQPKRCFLDSWDTQAEADAAVAALRARFGKKLKLEVIAGSTHIDCDELCDRAGLPHDEDY